MNTPLRLPNLGRVSCWSSSDLFVINSAEQYQIRILGRVLDQIYEIPVDNTLPNPQHQQIGAAAMAELARLIMPHLTKHRELFFLTSQDFGA